jgi:maleate cis-trans isomerase
MSAAQPHNPNLAKTRVGLIVPSVNATIEPEFYWVAPHGFSFHTVRIMLRETTPDALRAMNRDLDAALDCNCLRVHQRVISGRARGT